MRLNRVLLLAATINILIFALVFTISCSGEDGPRGKDGDGCTVERSGDDWNIICGEDVLGTLRGSGGKPGVAGPAGAAGENCWLGPQTSNGYEILCGTGAGTSKGFMNGCTVARADVANGEPFGYETIITCGTTSVNLCGLIAFDPKEEACTNGTLDPIAYTPGFCGKSRVEYNTAKQYCGYAKGDDLDSPPTTVYDLCGILGKDEQPYSTGFDEEIYCKYINKTEAEVAGEEASHFCDGQRFNENSWKGQYCGFASATAAKRTVLSGACDKANPSLDDVQGPNEVSFGQGYCEVQLNDQGKPEKTTIYSENLCGTSANNKPNNGAWKGEYCGFASADAVEPTKVYSGLCSDGKGPHKEKFNDGYCTITLESRKVSLDSTFLTDEFCNEDPTKKPNEGAWKKEYCGYGSATSTAADSVYTGLCDDGEGPKANGWNPNEYCGVDYENKFKTILTDAVCEDGSKINEGSWKSQYCGYAAKKTNGSKTTVQNNGCDDGDGPNIDDFQAGYCTVLHENRLTGYTTYLDEFCGNGTGSGNRLNENTWKKQYCGYTNANSEENDKVYNDMCDDGNGPNDGAYNTRYCQWETEDAEGTVATELFCGTEKNPKKFNEGSWKNEYCFRGNNTVLRCNAGYVALNDDPNAKSTDNPACVLPNVKAACIRGDGKDPIGGTFIRGRCGYAVTASAGTSGTSFYPTLGYRCERGNTNSDADVFVDCLVEYPATGRSSCLKLTNIKGDSAKWYSNIASVGTSDSDNKYPRNFCFAKTSASDCAAKGYSWANASESEYNVTWTADADTPGRCEFTPNPNLVLYVPVSKKYKK